MIPTYFDTTNSQERFMNLRAFFITNSKSAVLVQPRNSSLNNPAIYPQTAAIFGSTFGKQGNNLSCTKLAAMWLAVVSPVCHRIFRPSHRTTNFTCYWRNTIDKGQQLRDIMPISSGQFYRQRKSVSVSYQMMFRALFAAIRGVWPCFRPPKTARTEEESTMAREKSIWSAWRSLLSKARWIVSHIPAFCQSRNLLQQVIPHPQPISPGRSSHPMPVLSTNRIPVKASLSETGFRPGYRNLLFFFGIIGSMISHNLSSSIGFAMSNLLVFWLPMLSDIQVNYLSFC